MNPIPQSVLDAITAASTAAETAQADDAAVITAQAALDTANAAAVAADPAAQAALVYAQACVAAYVNGTTPPAPPTATASKSK